MQHRSPEKPPCLCPSVNEPEIIRADSHLAAVCGYLLLEQPLRRRVPAQVLSSGAGKEFEGEIFFTYTKTLNTGDSSSVLLAGQARPRHCQTMGTCKQLSPDQGWPCFRGAGIAIPSCYACCCCSSAAHFPAAMNDFQPGSPPSS